jgi:hypothetical protein
MNNQDSHITPSHQQHRQVTSKKLSDKANNHKMIGRGPVKALA